MPRKQPTSNVRTERSQSRRNKASDTGTAPSSGRRRASTAKVSPKRTQRVAIVPAEKNAKSNSAKTAKQRRTLTKPKASRATPRTSRTAAAKAKSGNMRVSSSPSDTVSLPHVAPKRLHERALVLSQLWFDTIDSTMIRVARFGGLFFVLVGAYFAFSQLSAFGLPPLSAQLCTLDAVCSTDTTNETTTSLPTTVASEEPVVEFLFDATDALSGSATLLVEVFNTDSATMYAVNDRTGERAALSVQRESSERYKFIWNTTAYSNDKYHTVLVAKNDGGVFEFEGPTLTVDNTPLEPDITITTRMSDDFATTGVVEFNVVLPEPLEDGTIDLSLISPSGKLITTVADGGCSQSGCFEFTTTLDLTTLETGAYSLKATVRVGDKTFTALGDPFYPSNSIAPPDTTDTTLQNSENDDSTTSTATVATPPALGFLADDGDELTGIVRTKVSVTGARSVSLKLREIEAKDTTAATLATHTTDTWEFVLDTTKIRNGSYTLLAEAIVDGETYTYTGPVVVVTNTQQSETDLVAETTDDSVVASSTAVVDLSTTVPTLSLTTDAVSPLENTVRLFAQVKNTRFVELYALPVAATNRIFIGLFSKLSDGQWRYVLDTTMLPNGEYQFIATTRIDTAVVTATSPRYVIANSYTPTTDALSLVSDLDEESIATTINTVTTEVYGKDVLVDSTATQSSSTPPRSTVDLQTFTIAPERANDDSSVNDIAAGIIKNYESELADMFQALSSAYRSNDPAMIAQAESRLETLRTAMLASYDSSAHEAGVGVIDEWIEQYIADHSSRIQTIETIVRERTSEAALRDTDGDGVTDYDELTLYRTDPQQPDTDGDGYIDGIEIAGGYNPTDASPEAVVRFESPKNAGVEQPEMFTVASIRAVTTVPSDTVVKIGGEPATPPTPFEISGTALPNSFVTIFVFSEPVIITVKTNADGSWNYRFEKELPDGEHEVYVATTDNAGKVIAKSQPFRFVKEAQAFTPIDAAVGTVAATTNDAPSLTSINNLTIVLATAVLAIGLVLILIGWNLDTTRIRRKDEALLLP